MPRQPSILTALNVANIFWPSFIVLSDLVFFASESPASVEKSDLSSRTDCEASINHIHILDLFSHCASMHEEPFWDSSHKDFHSACLFGKLWAEAVFAKLTYDFPSRKFRVYYTENDNPTVRFHQIHINEGPWLSESDWQQAIKAGHILIFDSNHRA